MGENYELLEQLGKGGFGTVQKAQQRATGLMRAIKSVAVASMAELYEVEALMDLDHPNVVRMYEYYTGNECVHIVQEYCSGGTLEKRVKAAWRGRLDPDDAGIALRQILRGLLCCHAHGLAHRDLKPDNFVYGRSADLGLQTPGQQLNEQSRLAHAFGPELRRDSTDPAAPLKLIDFGLCLGPLSLEKPATYVAAAGTLEYTAPETLPVRDAQGKLLRAASYTQAPFRPAQPHCCTCGTWATTAPFFSSRPFSLRHAGCRRVERGRHPLLHADGRAPGASRERRGRRRRLGRVRPAVPRGHRGARGGPARPGARPAPISMYLPLGGAARPGGAPSPPPAASPPSVPILLHPLPAAQLPRPACSVPSPPLRWDPGRRQGAFRALPRDAAAPGAAAGAGGRAPAGSKCRPPWVEV